MFKKSAASILLSTALLCSPLATYHTYAAAKSDYHYELSIVGEPAPYVQQDDVYMHGGTLYVQLNALADRYWVQPSFDATGTRAGFNGWLKKFAVRDGSKTAIVDGKVVTMSKPAYFKKEKDNKQPVVYVPFPFAIEALGGTYTGYNAQTKTVTAKNMQTPHVIYTTHHGIMYGVDQNGGDVFTWDGKGKPVHILSLHHDLDSCGIDVETTPGGLLLITIGNSYGEPHLNSEVYQFLYKNGALIRQNHADYRPGHTDLLDNYKGKIMMNDSHILRLIEDGSGNVVQTIDLTRLGNKGTDQQYSIEAMDDDMMLIRNAHDFELSVANLHTGHSAVLYKQILSANEKKDVEWSLSGADRFMGADRLTFQKRVGNTLYFTFDPPNGDASRTVTYDLNQLR
ncbi:copper amine oxidase N-terminal domain-containing protein [Paenibacillus wenxiniae]|uniref:Copper amine oxidase N-terminal domain-containing protein n=1 Tax=Paenibacillus wenxiniae TaxID=1636843 RepID=A0ABW4RK29_9BACL